MTYSELRAMHYKYNIELFPYLDDWKRNPYTFLKARFFFEASIFLTYLLLKTKISPNSVTLTYAFLGVAGGILLAFSFKITVILAACIFFFKGILDWGDGYYARLSNRTSLTGAILDPYTSLLGAVAFHVGLGFYVAQKSGNILFYFLIPLIPLFIFGNLTIFSQFVLFVEHLNPQSLQNCINKDTRSADGAKLGAISLKHRYGKLYNFINNFLDDRARSVDFICLILVLEQFLPTFISWIIFLLVVIKHSLIFAANFYLVVRGGWVERKMQEKAELINSYRMKV